MDGFVSSLAVVLGTFRRSPGSNAAWVDGVLSKFEREYPEDYHRVRRSVGLAHDLAAVARLSGEESATLSLSLLCHGLLSLVDPEHAAEPPRAWTDYLWREDWVAACLPIVHFIRAPGWDDDPAPSMPGVVAKAAWTIDTETIVRRSGTLSVLKTLQAEADTRATKRFSELIWSEEGQELCNAFVRHRGERYRLDPGQVKNDIRVLRVASAPTPAVSRAEARPARSILDVRHGESSAGAAAMATSDNFERRKRALSEAPSIRDLFRGNEAPEPDAEPAPSAQAGPDLDLLLRREAAREQGPPAADAYESAPVRGAAPQRQRPYFEEEPPETDLEPDGAAAAPGDPAMDVLKNPARQPENRDSSSPTLAEELAELKMQFDQIARIAEEGQALLAALSPRLEQFSSMLLQFDAILGRAGAPKAPHVA